MTNCNCNPVTSGNDSEWFVVSLGDDCPVRCRVAIRDAVDNHEKKMHGWARIRTRSGEVVTLYDSVDVGAIERELETLILGDDTGEAEYVLVGGRRAKRKARRKERREDRRERIKKMAGTIRKAAKKVGKNRLVKGLVKGVRKVIDNPLVKGVLAATPYGAAFYAARKGAQLAARAIKGDKKAKHAIQAIHSSYQKGNPQARQAMRMIRAGVKMNENLPPIVRAAVSGDEGSAFSYLGTMMMYDPRLYHESHHVFSGHDSADHTNDMVDALVFFAGDCSHFDGMKWAIARTGKRGASMARSGEGARNLTRLGRDVMVSRYAA